MGCFTEPLTAKLGGRGDWTKWDGRLPADLGARPLARVAFAARDGTFTAKGTTQASRLFEGSTASLLGAQTDLDLTARLAERKADLDGRVSSDAFRLGISGGLDLGRNRYDGLQLAFVLLRPGAIAPAVRGNGVRANARPDGAFAMPTVDYRAEDRKSTRLNSRH